MSKFHVNKETGKVGQCTATTRCPFGTSSEHFTTAEGAQLFYENSMENSTFKTNKKVKKVDPVLTRYGKLPKLNGREFADEWRDSFGRIEEFEAVNGELTKYYAPDPNELLTTGFYPSRERGTYLISKDEFLSGDNDFYGEVKSDHVVVANARIGGGNREDYLEDFREAHDHPDFLYEYDDGDTYAEFYFSVPKSSEAVEAFRNKEREVEDLRDLKTRYASVENQNMTPWGALASRGSEDYKNIKDSIASHQTQQYKLREYNESKESLKAIDKFYKELDKGNVDIKEYSRLTNTAEWQVRDIEGTLKGLMNSREELKRLNAAKESAEKLPEGDPLREFVLGDRGTGSYKTTEKQGRKNVKVTRTYNIGSILGKEVETAEGRVKSHEHSLDIDMRHMREAKTKLSENIEKFEASSKEFNELRKKAWFANWHGNDIAVPEMPEDFLKV